MLVLVLLFLGGWIMGGILNLAALASPQLVSQMQCPAGATAKQELVQQSFDQPGQKTLTFHCVDQMGNRIPSLPDAQTRALEFSYFYPRVIATVIFLMAVVHLVRNPPQDESLGCYLAASHSRRTFRRMHSVELRSRG